MDEGEPLQSLDDLDVWFDTVTTYTWDGRGPVARMEFAPLNQLFPAVDLPDPQPEERPSEADIARALEATLVVRRDRRAPAHRLQPSRHRAPHRNTAIQGW